MYQLYSTEGTSFFVWFYSFTQNILHSLLKIVLLIFGFKKNYNQDIFISLLLSVSVVNLLVLFISEIVTIDRLPLSISISSIEVIIFLLLFYSNTKDVKATKLLFFGKLWLLLFNIVSLVV
ncbi:hypothetical protein QMZ22_00145 [Enterococcus faecalis]|uniref:hypothetical protein n=1 Tax=Enterococcus faecalis TaxID=1351 RepID=UPI003DA11033